MSTERITGAWAGDPLSVGGPSVVIEDTATAAGTAWTTGGVRLSQLGVQPTLKTPWDIIGFSARARAFVVNPGNAFARLGSIWAGLIQDTDIPSLGSGDTRLPSDLSTFTKMFSGSSDPIACSKGLNSVRNKTNIPEPIGDTFMFPTPVRVSPGTALYMALVVTPTLCGLNQQSGGSFFFIVRDADFTVLYEQVSTPTG